MSALCVVGLLLCGAPKQSTEIIGRFRFLIPSQTDSKEASNSIQAIVDEGNREADVGLKIASYCRALSAMGYSLSQNPYNSKVLLNWASMRQLLGTVACKEPYTEGVTAPTVDLAIDLARTNPAVRYSAGLLALWSKDELRARSLFRDAMAYGLELTTGQQLVMGLSLHRPEDIAELIPPRFPYIVTLNHLIADSPDLHSTPEISSATSKALNTLQMEALLENIKDLQSKRISVDMFQQRLINLLPYAKSSARQIIDREMYQSVYVLSEAPEHSFFNIRSSLDEISIAAAHRSNDTKPSRSPFVGWGSSDTVNLFSPFSSIGFFSADIVPIKLISLRSESTGYVVDSDRLRILVSDNNQEWRDVTPSFNIMSLRVLNTMWYGLIAPKPVAARYWKIHYSGNERNRQFVSKLSTMIRAFSEPHD